MPQWSEQKVDKSRINNGNEFDNNANFELNAMNDIVNNSLYASKVAETISSQITNLAPNKKIEFKGSNPNLLHNGNFVINQMVQVSYTNTTSENTQTVDRWSIALGSTGINKCVVTPRGYGVNIALNGEGLQSGATAFIQKFDVNDVRKLVGETITFSIYVNSINSGSARFRITDDVDMTGTGNLQNGLNYVTYRVPLNATTLWAGIITNEGTSFNIDIKYMKVELGNIATPNSPQTYGEGLAICQRYFYRLSQGQSIQNGYAHSATEARVVVRLPVTMAGSPTIKLEGDLSNIAIYQNGIKAVTKVTVSSFDGNAVNLSLTTSGLTAGNPVACRLLQAISFNSNVF